MPPKMPSTVFIAFFILIGCPCADELAFELLGFQSGTGFSGNVLAVNLVNQVFQRDDIAVLGAFRCQRIKIVIDCNESYPKEWKDTLQVIAGFLIIAAKSGEVFHHNAVNLAFPHQIHQLLKLRTRKISTAAPIVTEQTHQLHIRLFRDVAADQGFLSLQRIRAGLASVLHGQAHITSGFINSCCGRRWRQFRHKRIGFSLCPCH